MNTPSHPAQSLRTVLIVLGAILLGIVIAQFLPPDLLGRHGEGSMAGTADHADHGDGQLWTCSMHPQVLEDEPGQCPICHMDLTPLRTEEAPVSQATSTAPGATSWTCPDHAMIVEDAPGTCPIDGLELIPLLDESAPQIQTTDTALPPRDAGELHLTPTMVQNMNVRTAPVERRDLTQPIRTVGYLEYDQQRMVTVTTKYSGWVEKVYVNYVGEKVRRGQPLFEIYSPELVQTEQELLSALRFAKEMDDAPEDARQRALSLVDSARLRLGYWDISPQQIAHLEETGEVFRTLQVTAPADGLVMQRMAGLEGMAVQPGMEIFHLANLASLWLSVELFEDQLAWVREGTPADISLSYFPGETLHGKVRFLEPELSETTRTMRAMIEVPNRNGRLRKGMYATVDLRPLRIQQAVAVPSQSVLRTGQRNVVVLALGEGRFAPREVTVGHEAEGWTEILDGLDVGTDVVTSAQFLLDSESKLREAVQKMIAERRRSAPPQRGEDASVDSMDTHSPGHRH